MVLSYGEPKNDYRNTNFNLLLNRTEIDPRALTHISREKDFDLLLQALDASISGIILTDNRQPDNPIIYCNTAFELMSGYSKEEIIGHNCRFLQKDDRHQEQRRMLKEAIAQGKSTVVTIRNYRKDGTLFWNELYISPIKDKSGHVTYFIGVQNDVTRRRKTEMELHRQQEIMEQRILERTTRLKESQAYLESIVETVRESLVVLDPQFKVISVNEHFLKTFKVSREETERKVLYELGNGQWNIGKLKELLETILPTNNPVEEFEVEHEFPHIGKKLMLLNAYRVELEGQFKNQILIAIEDITERKAIERRKDDFLSIASHELKTPLTTIKGYVQIMTQVVPDTVGDKFKEMLAKTSKHVNRLNDLISELLDVSKIQTGNIELHRIPFEFDQMMMETVENIQTVTTTHKLELVGKTDCFYEGDESHIVQVLNNLISNAIKYSPNEKTVKIFTSLVGNFLKVSVMDTGMGISPEEQKRIFERFYRVSEIQQRYPGMGIGLYICDQIIKHHGGTLWVESEKGKGSTFSFTLPLSSAKMNND